ncbi:MAG: PQQ-binding-like beta-propeller repeat protein [Capsulimonadales bacterium]|nr:PQQ-binding-like beta-propeller repeat protein [Capsulimonadales bacterium]
MNVLPPLTSILASLAFLTGAILAPAEAQPGDHWPSFRGANASGVADGTPVASAWDVEAGRNVQWKTAIPGLGHSSPIVWGDRLFVTTAISGAAKPELKVGLYGDIAPVEDDTSHEFRVYCLNKKTGKILWQRTAYRGVPRVKRHTKATHANSTMATDGKNVLAFFGSEGLYCYDMDGNLRWKKSLGVLDSGFFMVPDAQWGFASSPIPVDGKALVQCDIQKNGFVAAFDLKDGRELWRTPRKDVPTWSTPSIVEVGGRKQMIVNGWKHIGAYDVATGKEVWRLTGGGDIPVPTPLVAEGLIFITNAHGRLSPLYAIRPTAKGDITLTGDATSNTHIAWSIPRGGAYMQTPLAYRGYLYSCRDNGVLTCFEAKTGKQVYQERLGTGRTGFTASPVAADGKLFFTSEEGDVYVVKAGPAFEVIGVNPMGEVCMATPAISAGVLFWRTQGHLVAIGGK